MSEEDEQARYEEEKYWYDLSQAEYEHELKEQSKKLLRGSK